MQESHLQNYLSILKNAPRVLHGNISAETLRFCKSLRMMIEFEQIFADNTKSIS